MHADSHSVYEAAAGEHDPKRVRICSASSGASPSGSPCAQDLHHPSAATADSMRCDSPATPSHPPPTSPSGCCPPACAPCHGSNDGGHAWSGCVRSGVNGTTCARSAAAAVLRAAVEPYAGVLPPGVLRRLLHATARQSRATVASPPGSEDPAAGGWLDSGCGGPADARDAGGGRSGDADAERYHDGVTDAIHAVMNIIADAAEAVLLQLPALVRHHSTRRPEHVPCIRRYIGRSRRHRQRPGGQGCACMRHASADAPAHKHSTCGHITNRHQCRPAKTDLAE